MAAQNTLIQLWMGLFLYAFPPILLLKRTLITIRGDQIDEVVFELAEDIMVSSASQDSIQDLPLLNCRMDILFTTPAHEGHALPHQIEDIQVEGMEAEQQTLQDRTFRGGY